MKKTNITTFYRNIELEGLEITRVVGSRHIFPKHVHDDNYTLVLVEEGSSYCVGPEKHEAVVDKESVALINPGQVHSGVPTGDEPISYWAANIMLDVMTTSLGDILEKDGGVPEFRSMIIRDPALQNHLRLFFRLMTEPAEPLERDTALLESLCHLLIRYSSGKNPAASCHDSHLVCLAKEYLSEELARKMSLNEVAEAVGLSRYHFLRVFKKATGIPPHAFRSQRRIDLSQKLLRQGMAFSQIALETGFSDQSHFTKRFKQFTGATPRQYMSAV